MTHETEYLLVCMELKWPCNLHESDSQIKFTGAIFYNKCNVKLKSKIVPYCLTVEHM